ncbi:HNH endonuclease [Priestia megaterium]|uniref:HNH endonuclease n=1 Tax=Priestia megaterium TaxID=1404 RepID=UPI00211C0882|nr:HNH endonuclease [Priestia megaterium]
MKEIKLSGKIGEGLVAFVDDDIYEQIKDYKWSARNDGQGRIYARRRWIENGKWKEISLHRFVMGDPTGMIVDHRDGNTLDNTRSNLRVCSHAENMRNRKKHSKKSSKYKGVSFNNKHQKFVAMIKLNNKHHYIGTFNNEKEAALAYNNKALELHGEYANLNEIE